MLGVALAAASCGFHPSAAPADLSPVVARFEVMPSVATVSEHELLSVHVVARDGQGSLLRSYAGLPALDSDWGDLRVVGAPQFHDGEADVTVALNRETNPVDGLAHVRAHDGDATGSSSGIAVKVPSWTTQPDFTFAAAAANVWEVAITSPTLLRVDGGYRLYYTGTASGGEQAIGLATSTNGSEWTRYAGNPIFTKQGSSWEKNSILLESVVRDGDRWVMLYYGIGIGGGFGLADSSDGISWNRVHAMPFLVSGAAGPCPDVIGPMPLLVDGPGHYRAYFQSSAGLCTATTADGGVTWLPADVALVSGLGTGQYSPFSVLRDGTVYRLWYFLNKPLYATSSDGVSWAPSPANPADRTPNSVVWNEVLLRYEAVFNGLPASFLFASRP